MLRKGTRVIGITNQPDTRNNGRTGVVTGTHSGWGYGRTAAVRWDDCGEYERCENDGSCARCMDVVYTIRLARYA